jgi:hypothetical protein
LTRAFSSSCLHSTFIPWGSIGNFHGRDRCGATTVAVDPDERSDWALDPNVFGRFSEHLGSVMYPGVFEDSLKNGSFEGWHESGWERASGIVFPEVGSEEEWDTRGSGSSARGRRSAGWTSGTSAPRTTAVCCPPALERT